MKNKIKWSKIATFVDVFHIVFVLGSILLLVSGSWWEVLRVTLFYKILSSLWSFVVVLQILCLNCPLTQLSDLLKSLDNPNHQPMKWGFVYWICHDLLKLPVSAIIVTIVSLCIAVSVLAIVIVCI
jgi:hypothetical protein